MYQKESRDAIVSWLKNELGGQMETKIKCYACANVWSFSPPLSRRDECPQCHRDARVCKNCLFYDPKSYRECRESEADWVKDKEQGNFCGYFEASHAGSAASKQDDSKAKLNALFAKPQTASGVQEEKPKTQSLQDDLAKFLQNKKT